MVADDPGAAKVLLLPGWQDSGPGHWQTRWEQSFGYTRVQQHDWMRPLRGDWTARLEEVILQTPGPVVLVAHSLGCLLTAWWAAHSRNHHRVRGALLVAPPEIGRADLAALIPGWSPIARQRLPFASVLVASSDDPYGSVAHAGKLAADWGSTFYHLGPCGHINADSGLGDWPDGQTLLADLLTN